MDAHSRLTVIPWPQRASASGARPRRAGGVGAARPHRGWPAERVPFWVRLTRALLSARIWDLRTTRRFLQEIQLQEAAEIGGLTCGNNANRAPIMRYSPHLFSVYTSRPNTERTSDKYRCTSDVRRSRGLRPAARTSYALGGTAGTTDPHLLCVDNRASPRPAAPLMRGQVSTCGPHLLCVENPSAVPPVTYYAWTASALVRTYYACADLRKRWPSAVISGRRTGAVGASASPPLIGVGR